MNRERAVRNSSLELLKIIAIFLIAMSHSTPDYGFNVGAPSHINLTVATTNMQVVLLIISKYFGQLGNTIFLICSAYFLIDRDEVKVKKVTHIMADCFAASMFFVCSHTIFNLPIGMIYTVRSLLPITFDNNWFVSCYLLLYIIHPVLNRIIHSVKQRELLTIVGVLLVLYSLLDTIFSGSNYAYSDALGFIVIYFVTAYLKKYLKNTSKNQKRNCVMLVCSLAALFLLVWGTGWLGIYTGRFWNMLYWCTFMNPLIIMCGVAMFNIFSQWEFTSKVINYVSSFSLLIYVLHENHLFRDDVRPLYFTYVYDTFGYDYLYLWSILLAIISVVVSLILGIIYDKTFRRGFYKVVDAIWGLGKRVVDRMLDAFLKYD